MADRFFPNVLPDFVPETTQNEQQEIGDTLIKLLSMPYSSLSQHFKRTALDLKETVASPSLSLFLPNFRCVFFFPSTSPHICLIDPGNAGNVGDNFAKSLRLYSLLWQSRYCFLALQILSTYQQHQRPLPLLSHCWCLQLRFLIFSVHLSLLPSLFYLNWIISSLPIQSISLFASVLKLGHIQFIYIYIM